MGLGAKWSARAEIDQLRAANAAAAGRKRQLPRRDRRADPQIQSLESVINDLGARAQLDPAQARAMQKLPAVVKARAAGGSAQTERGDRRRLSTAACRRPKTRSACCATCCRASKAACATSAATSSGGSAGGRDAVDLAGARLADRHVRRPQRSVHRRAGLPPGPRHLDRQGPAGLRHGRRHGRIGRRTPATTATSSCSSTASA